MTWLFPSVVATLTATLILAGVYVYLYALYREKHLGVWALSWGIYSLRFVSLLLQFSFGQSMLLDMAYHSCAFVSGLLLFAGMRLFFNRSIPLWVYVAGSLGLLWVVASIGGKWPFMIMAVPIFVFLAFVDVLVGFHLFNAKRPRSFGVWLTCLAFILWGLHKLDYPFLRTVGWFAPWGYLFSSILAFAAALGILLIYFEDIRNNLTRTVDKFRQLVDSAGDAFFLVDAKGRLLSVNEEACRSLGYTRDELLDLNISDVSSGQSDQNMGQFLQELEVGQPRQISDVHRRKNGSTFPVEIRVKAFMEGSEKRILGLARDVTEQRKADSGRERLISILDAMPDLVGITTVDGPVLYINPAGRKMLGVEQNEVFFFSQFKSPAYLNQIVVEAIPRAIQTGLWQGDSAFLSRAGNEVPVALTIIAHKDNTEQVTHLTTIAHDISERQKATASLWQSEARHREMMEYLSSGVAVFQAIDGGSDFIFREFNAAAERIDGVSRGQILGRSLSLLFPGAKDGGLLDAVYRVWSTGIPERLDDWRFVDVRGVWRRQNSLYRLPSGEVVSVFDDITEKKRSEGEQQALHQISQLFLSSLDLESIVARIPVILAKALDFPMAAVEFFHAPSREMLLMGSFGIPTQGHPVMRVSADLTIAGSVAMSGRPFYLRDVTQRPDYDDQTLKSLKVKAFVCVPLKDKHRVFGTLEVADLVERDHLEKNLGLLEVIASHLAQEIERKQIDLALRQAKETWETTFDSVPDLIAIIGTDHVIQQINRSMAQRFDLSLGPVVGKKCYEVLHNRTSPLPNCPHKLAINLGKQQTSELEDENLGGFFEVTCTPLYETDGRVCGTVHVLHDITRRRKAEQARFEAERKVHQAQRLESLGVLAGGVAHDFNNVLMAILGHTELAMDKVGRGHAIRDNLEEVHRAGRRAADLVQQILAFSRQTELKSQPVMIHLVVKEALKLLRASIPANFAIRERIADCGEVLSDPAQIHQVIMNLCTNAYHAMKEEGKGVLTVRLERSDKDSTDQANVQGDFIRLSVQDTGKGMDELVQSRIFDPFFTTKKVGEGTGLGLSLVHGIIAKARGTIVVKSQVGHGSIFYIFLPRLEEAITSQILSEERLPQRGQGRILVVDDEPMLIKFYRDRLEGLGFSIAAYRDSLEALAAFRSAPKSFDCVLTDQSMPVMAGLELAERIRKIRPEIPILLVTGYSDRATPEALAKAGINRLLLKPVDATELSEALNALLRPLSLPKEQ